LFVCVTAAVLLNASDGLDASVRAGINGWATPALTVFFLFITQLGSVVVVYTLAVVETAALLFLGRRRDALYLAGVMIAAGVINNAVKFAVARARPEPFFGELPSSYS
ncbi:hypothetical protein MXD81_18735, partial [Microbacteriaceae bacterium K1510]|nr:hypothetical protein [Microbacteriaceae bacterium K1510]